ncbi:MAG: type II/IV secretion system protein [Nitrospinota bacterium]|nr:MAG: type II/IV secretion system protein [Nitrospinota bacterium]
MKPLSSGSSIALFYRGIQKGASDIHLLPQAHGLVLAFRVDGDLREANVLDRRLQRRIISRIKLLAGMDIAEHRLPQDGRIWLRRAEKEVEIRISVIPNIFGESVVMRILDKDVAIDLRSLGFRPADYRRLLLLTQRSYGLILVTGPTGSGKSTTLFALLKEMIHRPLHIITIEDPVESKIPGVNQIQVNAKIGLTFARVLRNILRHDPDVIMVGEMRDLETASIGIEAALTGHLMLSTLHTNSATDTVTRLTDIGIPSYLLAPALLGIVSQNLVKRLCPACRREISRDAEIYSLLQEAGLSTEGPLYEAVGCQQCQETGYLGRVMLYEFLEVNDQLRTAIYKGLGGSALREVAVAQGMIPKMQHALELATQGIISHEDLIRVLI